VAALLVQRARDDLRDLDVLITHLALHPELSGGLTDLERVRRILGSDLRPQAPLATETVLDIIGRHFAVRGNELRAQSRSPRVSTPRQIAMYLLREHCDLSYPQIGRVLRRHHTTVMHGCQRIASLRESNTNLGATVSMLEKELVRLRERGG
jgi:chromosomal replication initiator protein